MPLLQQIRQDLAGEERQPILGIRQDFRQLLSQALNSHRHNEAKFAEQSADLIYLRGAVAHAEVARAVHHQHRLLLIAFDRHEAHVRPAHRFADRLRIVDIVLAALAVRIHKLRGHQPRGVPELGKLPSPIMRSATGFHTDDARRQLSKKLQHFSSRELLAHLGSTQFVYPMHLKHPLRKIQPHSCNLHLDSPSS